MNVDTEEFMFLRGQVSGLTVRADEMAARQDEASGDIAWLLYNQRIVARDIQRGLDDLAAAMDRRFGRSRPDLRVLEGRGRSGGRHRRAGLSVVREAAQ